MATSSPNARGDVMPVYAHEGDIVEIHWRLQDGSFHREQHTCPPKDVRAARRANLTIIHQVGDGTTETAR